MEAGRRKAIERRKKESAQLTAQVVKMVQAGHSQSDIARALNKHRQTISRTIKRARENGLLSAG